jgi:hypothetical protein
MAQVEPVTILEVGKFVDEKTEDIRPVIRSYKDVVGRLIEEVTELAIESRMSAGEIFAHVADALANEARKFKNDVVYPSELVLIKGPRTIDDVLNEAVDVALILRDVVYRLNISEEKFNELQREKWNKFTGCNFKISSKGCLYAIK